MKILIIRFSSIGDIVITSPIVRCLKNKYPEAKLTYLTKKSFKSLVEHNPNIENVITLEKDQDKELIDTLKNEKFDLVIDLHKNLRTRRIKQALKTEWYSYKKLNLEKWLFVAFKINLLPKKHLIDRYFEGVSTLKVVDDGLGLDYYFNPINDLSLLPYNLQKKEYTVISIGGTYHTKQLPVDLILNLIKNLDEKIILIGAGTADEEKAAQILSLTNSTQTTNLVGSLSIDESAYLIKNAKNIITGDTGMMHIASAFDTQIQAIWGNTHPLFGMYAYRPQNKTTIYNHSVSLPCNPCSKLGSNTCPRNHFKCMNMQNVETIVKKCSLIENIQ